MLRSILLISVLASPGFLFAGRACSATLQVPSEYSSIQAAIDSATDGDVVLVSPGVYTENIHFTGLGITVASVAGPDETVIEAAVADSVVVFDQWETRATVLDGFTVRGGTGRCLNTGNENGIIGGGVLIWQSSPTIMNCVITGNITEAEGCLTWGFGAGVAVVGYQVAPLIEGNTIEFNVVSGDVAHGGGVYVGRDTQPEIRGNLIGRNATDLASNEPFGGGIYCFSDSEATISNNVIERNVAARGGGVSAFNCRGLIANNQLRSNQASVVGGGIRLSSTKFLEVRYNEITDNVAGRGGGFFADARSGTPTVIRDNIVTDNAASMSGGGVSLTGSMYAHRNTILRNDAPLGGGLEADPVGRDLQVENCVVAMNAAQNGGGMYIREAARVYNCTIYGNVADQLGGGVYFDGDVEDFRNTIIWGNQGEGNAYSVHVAADVVVDIQYCDVEGGFAGTGNFDEDPLLVDPLGNDDFHLRTVSPCVDSGTAGVFVPDDDFETDIRPIDGNLDGIAVVDVGADELKPETAALFGAVDAVSGVIGNVLFINDSVGDSDRRVRVSAGDSIVGRVVRPAAGGNGKYVIHANVGAPTAASVAVLPAQLGAIGFELRLTHGAMPIGIWNGIGKIPVLGESQYLDGSPVAAPSPAPSTFLDLPSGDPTQLPVGTEVTFQGGIIDPGTVSTKPASITNGIILQIE